MFVEGINQFSPSKRGNLQYVLPYLSLIYIGMPLSILAVLGTIPRFFMGDTSLFLASVLTMIVFIFIPLHLVKGAVTEINLFPIVRVVDKGLMIRVFTRGFDWELVLWKNVIEVIPSPLVLHGGELNWVIKINALADTHSAIGKKYGDGSSPAILLNQHIQDREKLIDIIQDYHGDGQNT